jgi:RNA polymerase sigma factor (sigma-70 family)
VLCGAGDASCRPVKLPQPDTNRWFTEQVLPHEPALRSWLRGLFPSLPDLDDLVQETYVRVLRAHSGAHIESTKAFLFTTARNLALDECRHRNVISFEPIAEFEVLHVLDEKPGISETVSHRQELEFLTEAIQSLPERCRQVLTLRKIYGLSQKAIAAQLGISEHTVEAQVGNGVRRCAEFLALRGLP